METERSRFTDGVGVCIVVTAFWREVSTLERVYAIVRIFIVFVRVGSIILTDNSDCSKLSSCVFLSGIVMNADVFIFAAFRSVRVYKLLCRCRRLIGDLFSFAF